MLENMVLEIKNILGFKRCLGSDVSSMITGANIVIDGGFSIN